MEPGFRKKESARERERREEGKRKGGKGIRKEKIVKTVLCDE